MCYPNHVFILIPWPLRGVSFSSILRLSFSISVHALFVQPFPIIIEWLTAMECNHVYWTCIYWNENPKCILYPMQFIYPYIGVFMVGDQRLGRECKRKKERTNCFIFLQIHSQWVTNLRETWLHHGRSLIKLPPPPPLPMLLRSANWPASKADPFRLRAHLDAKTICLFVFHIAHTHTHKSYHAWKNELLRCTFPRPFEKPSFLLRPNQLNVFDAFHARVRHSQTFIYIDDVLIICLYRWRARRTLFARKVSHR